MPTDAVVLPDSAVISVARASKRWIVVALLVLVVGAAGVRLWGIDRLLPHRFEPDAFLVYQVETWREDPGRATLNDFEQRYPTLLARTAMFLPPAGAVPADLEASQVERAHLERAAQPFIEMRVIVALLSTLLVPLTFLIARRAFGDGRALLAAAFVATSLLHLQFSGQARPHGAATSLQFVALLFALRAWERRTLASVAIAAVGAGLALACLQTGLLVAPMLAVVAWRSGASRGASVLRALGALAVMAAIALPFYPFLPVIDEHGITLSSHGGHPLRLSDLSLGGFAQCAQDAWEYDPLLTLAAACGGLLAFARVAGLLPRADSRSGLRVLLLAHALPYALVLGLNAKVFERLMLPLLPYLALAAADATGALIVLLARQRSTVWRVMTNALVVLAVFWLPASTAVHFARIARAPDTYEQCSSWLEAHAGADDIVLHSAAITLPVLHRRAELDRLLGDQELCGIPWLAYQRVLQDDVLAHGMRIARFPDAPAPEAASQEFRHAAAQAAVAALAPRWIVVEDSRLARSIPWFNELREVARERGQLVFEAQPSSDPSERGPHPYQGVSDAAQRLRTLSAFGSRCEIYELAR